MYAKYFIALKKSGIKQNRVSGQENKKQTTISQSYKLRCEKRNHVHGQATIHVINYFIFMQNRDFVLIHIFTYGRVQFIICVADFSVPVI